MNIIIFILFIFACIALLDDLFHLHLHLEKCVQDAFNLIPSLIVSITGWYALCIPFIDTNKAFIQQLCEHLPFDPSIIIGSILAPDLGGYFIIENWVNSNSLLVFAGVCLTSTLGAFFSFQLPIFIHHIKEHEMKTMVEGFLIGILSLTIVLIITAFVLQIDDALFNILPIILFSFILILGLSKFLSISIRIFSVFAKFIQFVGNSLFFLTIVLLFLKPDAILISRIQESCGIVLKMSIVIVGAFVLSKWIQAYGQKLILKISNKYSINQTSILGILLGLGSSLAMLPTIHDMDEKGMKMNAAFSISGAYAFGGQFAFICSVCPQGMIPFLVIKLTSSFLAFIIIHLQSKKASL